MGWGGVWVRGWVEVGVRARVRVRARIKEQRLPSVRIQSRHECELLVVRRLKEYLLKTVPGEG